MSFGIYFIGFLIMIAGLAYGAMMLNVPRVWIIVGVVVLLGAALATGARNTRQKDPA
jgi:hypothetical protein